MSVSETSRPWLRRFVYLGIVAVIAGLTVAVLLLLMNIRERKEEAKQHFVSLVGLSEDTLDAKVWAQNFPRQYDGYKRTVDTERTKHGGSEAIDKLLKDPRLVDLYDGYAFSKDFREERGHAYMLKDQDETRRVVIVNQPGSCLHCHSSVIPTYRQLGNGDVMAGFRKVCGMDWKDARKLVDHPVSCVDCHDPKTALLRVTRPGFLMGINELANYLADLRKQKDDEKKADPASEGYKEVLPHLTSLEQYAKTHARTSKKDRPRYDPNTSATRQELRSFVCGQCHVEYYFNKKDNNLLVYPWAKGLKVEQVEGFYDELGFQDWPHKQTGASMLKAQHPEFELWNQGIHARSGVACADCHMPYKREGAVKISDHHVRSPLLAANIARACQTCHRQSETELLARAQAIQDRTAALLDRAENAVVELVKTVNANPKSSPATVKAAQLLHRKAQWRLDFILAENSMGFHAPQEAARILAEAIDYARQGQVKLLESRRP
jgi:nitrite reductase (cytochrome c-552)